mgnify:CR=1 FL=1
MELINCPSPPHPFSLVMARIPESNYTKFDPLTLSKHFPNRNIHSLSHKRVIEHHVVVAAISEQLGHRNWHLEHENGGRPLLFVNGEKSESKISISHMQCPEKASYAASVLANVDYNIGVDIVYTNDDRLNRISQRTMSESEIKDGKLAEVWAIKEAVFKAYGPGIDFKSDIEVETPIDSEKVKVNFRGGNGNWLVHEISCVTLAMGPFK